MKAADLRCTNCGHPTQAPDHHGLFDLDYTCGCGCPMIHYDAPSIDVGSEDPSKYKTLKTKNQIKIKNKIYYSSSSRGCGKPVDNSVKSMQVSGLGCGKTCGKPVDILWMEC